MYLFAYALTQASCTDVHVQSCCKMSGIRLEISFKSPAKLLDIKIVAFLF